MDKPEIARFTLPNFSIMAVNELDVEKRFVVSRPIVPRPCSEFLVRRHQRGCNIMGKEVAVGVDMEELDEIVMSDNSATTSGRKGLGWDDLPVVVAVRMSVASHLLTYTVD
jgi:hypothetical protein